MKLKMAVLMLIVFIMGAIAVKCSRDVGSREGYAPIQPINFSHRVHAGSNLIPCQYCHFAADKGRHAGIPPTELCLNCHKKIKPDSLEVKKIQAAIDNKKILSGFVCTTFLILFILIMLSMSELQK